MNFSEYPIDKRGSHEYDQLVENSRNKLKLNSYFKLSNFLTTEGIGHIKEQCTGLVDCDHVRGNQVGRSVNCFYSESNAELPDDHPVNMTFARSFGVVRDDMIGPNDIIRQVYDNQHLVQFLSDVLCIEELYQSRDSYQALTINVMGEGEYLHWHFDCNAFAVTLGIQRPETGGEFQFIPDIGRGSYDAIREVILAEGVTVPGAQEFEMEEGNTA